MRQQQATDLLVLFADAATRAVQPPFPPPAGANPSTHQKEFLAWFYRVPEGGDLVRSAHSQGLSVKTHTADEAAALQEKKSQHAAMMRTSIKIKPTPRDGGSAGNSSAFTELEALENLAISNLSSSPLSKDTNSIWLLECPHCHTLIFGGKNTTHKCSHAKKPLTRSALWHIPLASPVDLLLRCHPSDSLLGSSPLITSSPALNFLPADLDPADWTDVLTGVNCMWDIAQAADDPDLVIQWREYQSVVGLLIQTHTPSQIDGYYVQYNANCLNLVVGVITSEKPGVLVFSDQCGTCCFLGLFSVKKFVQGGHIHGNHWKRDGSIRPPSTHLLDDYAEAEFEKSGDGERVKCQNPGMVRQVMSFWDLPFVVKIRLVHALFYPEDPLHGRLGSFTYVSLLAWHP